MERKINFYKIALTLLFAIHLAGFLGLQHPLTQPLFQRLIAFNLMLTAGIVFCFHKDFNPGFFLFSAITFLTGYFVEVTGVKTGMIFGVYTYGSSLGYKILDVPILIGLNWLVLIYCINVLTNALPVSILMKVILSAYLMIVLDFFIEPMAIRYDLWSWQNNQIPLQNYVGWFVVSIVLSLAFHRSVFNKNNKIAPFVYLAQLLFFIALQLF